MRRPAIAQTQAARQRRLSVEPALVGGLGEVQGPREAHWQALAHRPNLLASVHRASFDQCLSSQSSTQWRPAEVVPDVALQLHPVETVGHVAHAKHRAEPGKVGVLHDGHLNAAEPLARQQ
eukprot:2918516-Pyramimonas_sp.AAC.1